MFSNFLVTSSRSRCLLLLLGSLPVLRRPLPGGDTLGGLSSLGLNDPPAAPASSSILEYLYPSNAACGEKGNTSGVVHPCARAHSSAFIPFSRSLNDTQAFPSSAKIEAHSVNPFLAAISKAVSPSLFMWSTLRPKRRKERMRISIAVSFPTIEL